MNIEHIQNKFERLGARVKFRSLLPNRIPSPNTVRIDIASDRQGEYFEIATGEAADLEVLDMQPRERHLLLLNRQYPAHPHAPAVKHKFLCGHDERHWFVAGIPESAPVSSVVTAKEALKPPMVLDLEGGRRGKRAHRHRRKTETFVRQGEWFFIPSLDLVAAPKLLLRHEPLRRGGGKPHMCEYLFRTGGQTVYVCHHFPNGLTEKERTALLARNPLAASYPWRVMRRDAMVYVRGRVSHADHATIRLDGWHRVLMNTEGQSSAMNSVAFLD